MLAALLVGAGLAQPAGAAPADGVVGDGTPGSCTESALTTALAAGGLITFNCGGPKTIAISTVKVITQDITLDGGDLITLSGGNGTRLFAVNSGVTLRLEHIVLDEAASTGSDGGAIANHGTLVVDHSIIQHSQTDADHSGGAIFSDGPVTITHSTLRDNSAGSAGALFANFGQAVVAVNDSTFSGNQTVNTTTGYGGAIWLGEQAQISMTDSTLLSNTARFGGGLFVSQNATATLTSTGAALVSGNLATFAGGGIYESIASVNLTDVTLSGNSAHNTDTSIATFGGGLDNFQGQLNLQATAFTGNSANWGGGLFAQSGSVQGADVTLSSNTAITGGGADLEVGSVGMTGLTLSGNTATGPGGGLHVAQVAMILTDANLTDNTAGGPGGGLDVESSAVIIDGSTFSDNQADAGGGLADGASSDVTLHQPLFTGNRAHQGGALFVNASMFDTGGATFSSNTAQQGGALYINSGLATLITSTVSSNTAFFGAGIDDEDGNVTLANSTISGNAASKGGGGIWHGGGHVALTNVTLSGNVAIEGGGLDERSPVLAQSLVLSNTVVAAGVKGVNCFTGSLGAGAILSAGYNLSSDGTCATSFNKAGDLNNIDPHLGPLANNGGPTLAHLPGLGSLAIDAIPAGANGCGTFITSDQRGAPRPINGKCDMGAVEAGWIHPVLWLPIIRH